MLFLTGRVSGCQVHFLKLFCEKNTVVARNFHENFFMRFGFVTRPFVITLALITSLFFLGGVTISFFLHNQAIEAMTQGLGASFNWSGPGNGTLTASVINSAYTGPKPAKTVYAIYWCKKAKTTNDGCAPDFSGDNKSDETLTYQTIDLAVPNTGQTQSASMPTVATLATKQCGRFQVDLGLAQTNGGIVGGSVFVIGPDCVSASPTPSVTPSVSPGEVCPYTSTQAQVQMGSSDPWGDSKTVTLGNSVLLGGFHNGTGRFAGDSVNNYSPNTANIEFFITDPNGGFSQTLFGNYPLSFTPTKTGTYAFVGKTRKNASDPAAGYFGESTCIDSGAIIVTSVNPTQSAPPIPTPPPPPAATPTPVATPTATPIPTPTTTQVKLCKYQDDNANGIKDEGERVLSWDFKVRVEGESERTVTSHWWDVFSQGCVITDILANKSVTVEEIVKSGWRSTGHYFNGARMDGTSHAFTSHPDEVNVFWFLNTFTTGGTPIVTPTPTPTPVTGNTTPECLSLSANPTFGGAKLPVSFIGKGRDGDGIIRQIEFTFGDGNSQTVDATSGETNRETTSSVTHTYNSSGTYWATVRTKDNSGTSNQWSTTPESCKQQIQVTGEVLGSTTPLALPKAGVSELFTAGYILGALGGTTLKLLARKLSEI